MWRTLHYKPKISHDFCVAVMAEFEVGLSWLIEVDKDIAPEPGFLLSS